MKPIGAADHEYATTQRMSIARAALPVPSEENEPVIPRAVLKMNMTTHPLCKLSAELVLGGKTAREKLTIASWIGDQRSRREP